jgi:hypothetical protein
MRDFRAVYRGYAIYISGIGTSWSSRAEPINSDLPILATPESEDPATWGTGYFLSRNRIRFHSPKGAQLPITSI